MRQEAAGLPQWVAAIPIVFAFAMMVLRFLMRATDSIISWRRRENAPEGAVELH
jgi:TRAP-type C4-dicarboxylate transport system permease small subunit